MKTLLLPILLVGSVATVGMFYLSWILIENPYGTLIIRFSQSFFNILTLIPLSMIGAGCLILVWCVFFCKFDKKIRQQIAIFSILVMLVGFSVFGFYMLD